MSGNPTGARGLLIGATVATIGGAILLAVVTIDPPPAPVRRAKTATAEAIAPVPPPVVEAAAPAVEPTPEPKPVPPPAPNKLETQADWEMLPIDELRPRANRNEVRAMEELGRRLLQGSGVAMDAQAGAGWLLRAADLGSAQSAFNIGVMYERGFVVERDSTRAGEWYRKAVDAGLPMAKHNLALMLRDGKGMPRDGKAAIDLLRSAARQGMAASMFSLGDIYDRGDAGPKDPAAAIAWFAIAAEFDRQRNRGEETPLGKTAVQRSQALQRVATPAELERAQKLGQEEFRQIADALAPKPSPPPVAAAPAPAPAAAPTPPEEDDTPGWPKAATDQVRVVQQAMVDLKLLRDKPDGALGPMTRAAIRDFQRGAGLRESGEASKEVFLALRQALERHAATPRVDPPKPEPPRIETAKPVVAQAPANPERVPPRIDIPTAPAPPPPTSADIARAMPDPDAWPVKAGDQVKAIQQLLIELKIFRDPADGQNGSATRTAIREYQRMAGLKETGEPGKALFDSLKEMRALMAPKRTDVTPPTGR